MTKKSYCEDTMTKPIKPTEVLVDEDQYLQFVSQIKPVSPYTIHGVADVQVHSSPMENIRVAGAPRLDVQYELSNQDEGEQQP